MPSILENTNAIEEYLNGDSMNDIGKRYGVSRVAVKNYLVKHNVEMRDTTYKKQSKYSFNEHWLDELDCQEKWYFLGFFAADGCCYNKNGDNCIRMKLKQTDKYMLENFMKFFGSNRPIIDRKDKNIHNQTGYELSSELKLGSKYLFEKMVSLGFPERKSTILKFPKYIPEEFLSHFIRGYFDGDGNINIITSYGGTKRATITITGSNYFIPELQKILNKRNINSFVKLGKSKKYSNLDIDRQEDIKPFLDWIYKDSKIHLKRKYDRYIEFLNGRDFDKDEGANRRRIKELEPKIYKDYKSGNYRAKEIQEKYKISAPTYYRIIHRYNNTQETG